jgi:hypothetical protein
MFASGTVSLLYPFGTGMKIMYLKVWGGKILINKFAFSVDQRWLHMLKHYVSAEGCTRMWHN